MKRICLLLIVICQVSGAMAQEKKERWLLGAGITYCSYIASPGLNLNVTYRAFGNFHIGPDFSALLTREHEEGGRIVKRKEVEYNLNAQQLFELDKRLAVYPLVGINWSRVTVHPDGEDPNVIWFTALNTGGGIELKLKGLRLFFESKWVSQLNKVDLTTGLALSL